MEYKTALVRAAGAVALAGNVRRLAVTIVCAALLSACGGGRPSDSRPMAALAEVASTSAVFPGPKSSYTVTRTTVGYTVTEKSTGVATQVDASAPEIDFADSAVLFDATGTAAQAYRLYQAAFARKPDMSGLGYQINAVQQIGLTAVAGNFLASPEFQATYGSLTDAQFVTTLYRNVLHRGPEPAGLQFHLDELASGQSRALVLTHFSESPENRSNVLWDIQSGVTYFPVGASGFQGPDEGVVLAIPPMLNVSLSSQKVRLGEPFTATWTSRNALRCSGSAELDGSLALTGSQDTSATVPGAHLVSITCSNSVGSTTASATLIVPIPVKPSSYENKLAAASALGPQPLPPEVTWGNAVAFADFFQDGSYSMVTHSLEYDPQDASTSNKVGHVHFWQQVDGSWVDRTSQLLADNAGCLHPRKAVVADFGHNGRPSILIACHGFDAPPFPGESPILVLAQADGSYRITPVGLRCFCHSATAADIDGDGWPDAVITGSNADGQPVVMLNNRDGTFTKDASRISAQTKYHPIFTAELFDTTGKGTYDLFLGGHEQSGDWPATVLMNDGSGQFPFTGARILPALAGYGFPTDVLFLDGNFYLARTIDDASAFYAGAAIQKIDANLVGQALYQHVGPLPPGTSWINWIIPAGPSISTMDSKYQIAVPR